jgi:hypothetical protein
MFHWLIIIVGIIIISLSISNPFFKLVFNKNFDLNVLLLIFIRIFILLLGIIIIFIGLYVESKI